MKNVWLGTVSLAAFAIAGSVQAADLKGAPIYKAPPMATYNWTGFYLGVNAGLGVSQITASTPNVAGDTGGASSGPGSVDRGGVGFAGGMQGGFNWQFASNWVAGIEGDIGYLGINRSSRDWDDTVAIGVKTDWYGTLRGRLGYTNGPSLFYATGGAAFVNLKNNFDDTFFISPHSSSKSETAAGWVGGGGIETVLGGNWSAKAEYLYVGAGAQDVSNVLNGFNNLVPTAHFDNRFHIYRYGLNYKFGGPAVAASILPTHNWTGLYIGGNIGAGLSQDLVTAPTNAFAFAAGSGTSVEIAGAGFEAGVQAGYNWQFTPNWVLGVEGDIQRLGTKRTPVNWDDPDIVFGAKADWYGTLRARLAYSTGPALLYVTGGAAFVRVTNNFDSIEVPTSLVSKSEMARGWTVGGGIEAALTPNWTAKTEYLYVDAGSQDVFNPDIGFGPVTAHFKNRFHIFRYGLNYKIGG